MEGKWNIKQSDSQIHQQYDFFFFSALPSLYNSDAENYIFSNIDVRIKIKSSKVSDFCVTPLLGVYQSMTQLMLRNSLVVSLNLQSQCQLLHAVKSSRTFIDYFMETRHRLILIIGHTADGEENVILMYFCQ